jgi:formate dehydrogenase subunit delta
MKIERLVHMANDIGNFFKAEPNRVDAVNGIANHLQKFWEPRMRKQLINYVEEGGAELDELVLEAIRKLGQPSKAA